MASGDGLYLSVSEGERDEGEAMIARYVEAFAAQFAGSCIPPSERGRIVEETEDHLAYDRERRMFEGLDPVEASRLALTKYGDPATVAASILNGRYNDHILHPWAKRLGYSRLMAILVYGASQLFASIYITETWRATTDVGYRMPISPSDLRTWLPSPLPLPQAPHELFELYGLPFLWPFFAGLVFGWFAPVRPSGSTLCVMVPLSLYAFVQATLMLPSTTGLLNALLCLFVGLPLACIGSVAAASLRRSWQIGRESAAAKSSHA